MDAGVAVALVHFRQALGVMEALGAQAGEAVDAILAGAPVVAGVAGTLINVDVAHAPWEGGRKEQLPCKHGWHGVGSAPTSQIPLQPLRECLLEAGISGHTCWLHRSGQSAVSHPASPACLH